MSETESLQREPLRYILERGCAGSHLLFDVGLIRRTFSSTERFVDESTEWRGRVLEALRRLAELPSVDEQRVFIAWLPRHLQERICFHYFELLDQVPDGRRRPLH